MRRIIIDTDTASDDAVAILMALRSPVFRVEGITTVAGNVEVEQATINALISIDVANTYEVPVYQGESKPLKRMLQTGQYAHGVNGMGDIKLPTPKTKKQIESAVDYLIKIIEDNPYELELVCIGPLTNVANVILKSPSTIRKLKGLYLMGGNGNGFGNSTEYAEYNFFVDPEAADIVLESGINPIILPWNTCLDGLNIGRTELEELNNINSSYSKFTLEINNGLLEFCISTFNQESYVLADPGIIAFMIDEKIGESQVQVYSRINLKDQDKYGSQVITSDKEPNCTLIQKIELKSFMKILKNLLLEK